MTAVTSVVARLRLLGYFTTCTSVGRVEDTTWRLARLRVSSYNWILLLSFRRSFRCPFLNRESMVCEAVNTRMLSRSVI